MDILNKIIEILGILGVGAIIGMILQYYSSKKLKKFETKLVIFRRVYKQLYLLNLYCNKKDKTILSSDLEKRFGLSLLGDLGDILFYADKKLKKLLNELIEKLFWAIKSDEIEKYRFDGLVSIDKETYENIEKIKKYLKKI